MDDAVDNMQNSVQEQPYVAMRRCQSVEEGNRKRLPPNILNKNSANHERVYGYNQNTESTRNSVSSAKQTGATTAPVNMVLPIHNSNAPNFNGDRPALQPNCQNFQNEMYSFSQPGHQRIPQSHMIKADILNTSNDTTLESPGSEELPYTGSIQLVDSTDSDKDDFAETVIWNFI